MIDRLKAIARACGFGHVHRWETVAVNGWGIATRERCKCGLERHVEPEPGRNMRVAWHYSDGTVGPALSILDSASGLR